MAANSDTHTHTHSRERTRHKQTTNNTEKPEVSAHRVARRREYISVVVVVGVGDGGGGTCHREQRATLSLGARARGARIQLCVAPAGWTDSAEGVDEMLAVLVLAGLFCLRACLCVC